MQFQLKFQQVFLVTFDKLIPILREDAKGKEQPSCATRRRGRRMGGVGGGGEEPEGEKWRTRTTKYQDLS